MIRQRLEQPVVQKATNARLACRFMRPSHEPSQLVRQGLAHAEDGVLR